MRVAQRRERARLDLEALSQLRIGRDVWRKHLDRDITAQPRVGGAVHFAHATAAEWFCDGIRPEACTARK